MKDHNFYRTSISPIGRSKLKLEIEDVLGLNSLIICGVSIEGCGVLLKLRFFHALGTWYVR